jgi:hypothetical protein
MAGSPQTNPGLGREPLPAPVPSGVFGPRGAERVLAVRRAPRGENTPLDAMHCWPQQKAYVICGLGRAAIPNS